MLIDWVTARVPVERLSPEARAAVAQIGDRIQRWCPRTGVVRYETSAWDSIRSDSHQIACRAGLDLWIQGSPARIIGDGCTVFGSGAAAALDLRGCVERMKDYVGGRLGIELPAADEWIVSRVDVTCNLDVGSLPQVRAALRVLRDCEGGRYRVSQQAGDTVYWSHRSKMRAGKAYAKGPHLRYLIQRRSYTGRSYSEAELAAADRLLRLELKLGREWFARHEWRSLMREDLHRQWNDYFGRMIGTAELTRDEDVRSRIMAAAESEGQGRAAYGCWALIRAEGWERAREMHSRATWYRHLRVLRRAGLGDADIAAGRVVPLRRTVLEARMVTSWQDLEVAA